MTHYACYEKATIYRPERTAKSSIFTIQKKWGVLRTPYIRVCTARKMAVHRLHLRIFINPHFFGLEVRSDKYQSSEGEDSPNAKRILRRALTSTRGTNCLRGRWEPAQKAKLGKATNMKEQGSGGPRYDKRKQATSHSRAREIITQIN